MSFVTNCTGGWLSEGKVTLSGSGCCSVPVVIARLSLRGPLSTRSFPLLGRAGYELVLLGNALKARV